jgi:hypothetical protein
MFGGLGRRVLKPDGTLWVTGTHHIIFSFALQKLGFRIASSRLRSIRKK